ncbi:MAG: MgtC/SapB family protein [Candidatus Omnitrophota bacterium]
MIVSEFDMALRLLLAAFLSGLVGYEREIHGRLAGFRTHILVCVGSTLIMLTSMHIFDVYRGLVTPDPARIAAQVVSGIGFLGAGTIIRFKASVRGLTTAASLWTVAGIGLAVGSGLYLPAVTTTIIVLMTLFFLNRVEKMLIRKDWYKVLEIETKTGVSQLEEIRSVVSEYEIEIKDFEICKSSSGDMILKISLKLLTNEYDNEILSRMRQLDGIKKVSWVSLF